MGFRESPAEIIIPAGRRSGAPGAPAGNWPPGRELASWLPGFLAAAGTGGGRRRAKIAVPRAMAACEIGVPSQV